MIANLSVEQLTDANRVRLRRVLLAGVAAAIAIGLISARMASTHSFLAIGLVLIPLPLLLWRWPDAGVVALVGVAALVEQFPIPISTLPGTIGTDQILFFSSFNESELIGGVMLSPLDLTIMALVPVWLVTAARDHRLAFPRSQLAIGFGVFAVVVAMALINGHQHGGDAREALRELRPWVYLIALYFLGSQLLTRARAIESIWWALILGIGIKGIQGAYRFVSLVDVNPKPDYLLNHEEAVFFGMYTLLTAALWIFGKRGALRTVATALLPMVVFANVANNRRTSWLILLGGLIPLLVIAWLRLPQQRRRIRTGVIALAAVSVVYLPLFWNNTGLAGEPARAIRSIGSPDQRDLLSNQYRGYENANLMADIRRSTPFGEGFGVPIDYSTVPFYDLTRAIPSLRYEPHNSILYVWLRFGSPGALVFWFVMGAAFVAACRLALTADRDLTIYGAFVICALVAYLIEGEYDLGLTGYRVALCMGCLLGGLEAARRLSRSSPDRPAGSRPAPALSGEVP